MDVAVTGQYVPMLSANQYTSQALMYTVKILIKLLHSLLCNGVEAINWSVDYMIK